MTFNELNRNQLIQLKQALLCKWYEEDPDEKGSPSWGELAEADSLVSDEQLEEEYGEFDFSEDDFSID